MGGEGSMLSAIKSLKNNKRNKNSKLDKLNQLSHSKSKLVFDKKATPQELEELRKNLKAENQKILKKRIILFCAFMILLLVVLFLFNKYYSYFIKTFQ